jgi:uncharacterized membrane protein YccC
MTAERLAFAIANTVAVLGALCISFAFDLDHPYWSVFSVFVVAGPLSGMVRSKAMYRWLGTIIGATGALLMVPPLVHSPELLSLAMAVWVGFWLWLSLLDRTPRSYIALLAGYTATIVGLSVVDMPEAIFDTTIARLEEISIGIACAAVAHSLFFPRSVAAELNERIDAALRGCARWIATSLSEDSTPPSGASASTRLSSLVEELFTLNTHVAYETSNVLPIGRRLAVLQDRLASLLPHLSSAQRAIDALRANGSLRPPLQIAIAATVRWTGALADAPDALAKDHELPAVLRRSSSAQLSITKGPHWSWLTEEAATSHLQDLAAALEDCVVLARAVRDRDAQVPPELQREVESAHPVSLYRDVGLALLSGGAAVVAVLFACAIWIAGSWPEGAIAAQFAAIGCSLFARLDRPAPMIRSAVVGILVALPFAALYEFAIFPRIDGFPMLALVLAPVFLIVSYMQAVEKLEGAGIVLAIAFSGALALNETYVADFAAFVNTNLAEVSGLLIAITVILVFRTIDPKWNAQRISRASWRALSRMAESDATSATLRPAHLLDRIGQVTARVEQSGDSEEPFAMDPMRDLRVGVNLATITAAEATFGPGVAPRLRAVRQLIASKYRSRANDSPDENGAALVHALDASIGELEVRSRLKGNTAAIAALVSLRMDLSPERPLIDSGVAVP